MGLFHVGRAFESLRNSNFDTVSAIGEVIDNSIQADARTVKIRIESKKGRKKPDLTGIAFGDDGKGMTREILKKCVQVGFSERYNDRTGIGRFGVGMTLGAVTQCTRIEVYSKPRGGNWNFIFLDVDKLKHLEDAEPMEPIPCEVPRKYADLVGETGTLIVWMNWDKEDATIDEIRNWIGRVYRKFIGEETIIGEKVVPNKDRRYILLDDGETTEEIPAMDPLYVTKTKFGNEVTKLEKPIIFEEEIHKFDKPPGNRHKSKKIVIRTSLLPASWRSASRMGNSPENQSRRVNTNEGISIIRNNREVFYGHIAHYRILDKHSTHYKSFIDMDRYWGCEIVFDAELDHWFSVKNIKVGAKPIHDLRLKIQEELNDTIHAFRKEIRDEWARNEAKKKEETGGATSGTGKAESVLGGDGATHRPEPSDIDTIIKDSGATKEEVIREIRLKLEKSSVVFHKNFGMDGRGNFIDIISRGGNTLIELNMNHPFFKKFFDILEHLPANMMIHSGDESESASQAIETNLYLFLGGFVHARGDFKNTEESQPIGDILDKLIHNWTFYLGKHVKTTLE